MSDTNSPPVSLSSIFGTPTPDYTNQYNTPLAPDQEAAFQAWAANRQGDLQDYDLRGAWLNNAQAAANGHLPDTWKKPNHPTFSTGSRYSSPQTPGGVWAQMPHGGPWVYAPSQTNANTYGMNNLQSYFEDREPQSWLLGIMPSGPSSR